MGQKGESGEPGLHGLPGGKGEVGDPGMPGPIVSAMQQFSLHMLVSRLLADVNLRPTLCCVFTRGFVLLLTATLSPE